MLWIGWLRNRLRDDPQSVPSPVLAQSASIKFCRHGGYDAVLALDENGEPDLANPRIPAWPEAEFIVGNPPFIGKGKDIREALGDEYVAALTIAYPNVPRSADFVMYWWHHAASLLHAGLTRFGLISTNSIRQLFNRAVVAAHLHNSEATVSLAAAVFDHPWRAGFKDAAVVRISMTVARSGCHPGKLLSVANEANVAGDDPRISFVTEAGFLNADLTIGADASQTVPLGGNFGVSWNGVMLAGRGFLPNPRSLLDIRSANEDAVLKPFLSGRDVTARNRNRLIIDPNNLSEKDFRSKYPIAYDYLLQNVRPIRAASRDLSFRDNWWLFGRNRSDLRKAVASLSRYIVVPETSVYRLFTFVDCSVLPEHRLVCIASADAFHLGVLLSRAHSDWSLRVGGTLEDRPTYTKTRCFDPFPFPDPTPEQRTLIADLAEELDATRKLAIAETDRLTMTELYNLREKLRSGEPMSDADRRRATKARAGIIDRLHEQLDQAVADAYGWGAEWAAGVLGPSEIVTRLVALNHQRAAEEAAGHIRWLRPEYQAPRFGSGGRGQRGSVAQASSGDAPA